MITVEINEEKNIAIVNMSGKILGGPDGIRVNEIMNDLLDQNISNVVMDLNAVDIMNSSGLGIIIQSANLLKQKSGAIKLANVSKKIESLLVITKLNTVFDTYETVEEAMNSF